MRSAAKPEEAATRESAGAKSGPKFIRGSIKRFNHIRHTSFTTAIMNNSLFHSIEGTVAYGEIGLDGSLGHNDLNVFPAPEYDDWEAISAHGPSLLHIETKRPLRLLGTLSASASRLFREHPVEFHVGDWRLGQCVGPWDVTRDIVIPPGKYELNVKTGGDASHCHSVWLCREESVHELATPENTVFLSVDTYGPKHGYSSLMRSTAANQGIDVIFLDEGLTWRGFYHHKIERMMSTLRRFRESGKRFAFILDARDIAFLDPLPLMLAKFNAINEGKIVYNTDGLGAMYPCAFEWFREACRRAAGHFQGILNAGVLVGGIDTFLEAMPVCRDIRGALIEGAPWPGVMERLYRAHGSWRKDDDQYLYHICQVYRPELFAPDVEKRLCVHLKGYPTENWPDDHEYRDGCCAGFASILHFPDLAGSAFWDEWIASRGRLPEVNLGCVSVGKRRSGFGKVGFARELGYEGKRVKVPCLLADDETISAHADSTVDISVRETVRIAGALNESAIPEKEAIGANFFIDGLAIGQVGAAGDATSFTVVPPGNHRLSIVAVGTKKNCHSLWVVRRGEGASEGRAN